MQCSHRRAFARHYRHIFTAQLQNANACFNAYLIIGGRAVYKFTALSHKYEYWFLLDK